MKRLVLFAALAAACATGGPRKPAGNRTPEGTVEVDDVLHGVKYTLPPAPDGWQVAHEGAAHVSGSGVQVEVGSFPLTGAAEPSGCRDAARRRLAVLQQRSDEAQSKRAPEANAEADAPRDQSTDDSPTATWSFSRGPSSSAVRSRWGFFARGADCLMLQVTPTIEGLEIFGREVMPLLR